MAKNRRWLVWILPLVFLGAVFGLVWHQDPDFWRSPHSMHQMARQAAGAGENRRSLELARKAWAREPGNAGYGLFLGQLYLDAGQPREALEVARQVAARDPQA